MEPKYIDCSDLKTINWEIFNAIKAKSKGPFSINSADKIMSRLGDYSLNASNKFKEDLIIKIHDDITGSDHEIGFSIKSMIGGPATLLNASGATNFTYEIKGLDEVAINNINNINGKSKIRDRLEAIKKYGAVLEFTKVDSAIFEENLRLCETIMPEILANMLLFYNEGRGGTLEGLIDQMVSNGAKVSGFSLDRIGYELKLQNLLYIVALGMVPNTKWNGFLRAYGGYIIVRDDGEIVGYNIYNADIFRTYLLKTTKLETASTTRHKFGKIYIENGKMLIKLNLQIRFLR